MELPPIEIKELFFSFEYKKQVMHTANFFYRRCYRFPYISFGGVSYIHNPEQFSIDFINMNFDLSSMQGSYIDIDRGSAGCKVYTLHFDIISIVYRGDNDAVSKLFSFVPGNISLPFGHLF